MVEAKAVVKATAERALRVLLRPAAVVAVRAVVLVAAMPALRPLRPNRVKPRPVLPLRRQRRTFRAMHISLAVAGIRMMLASVVLNIRLRRIFLQRKRRNLRNIRPLGLPAQLQRLRSMHRFAPRG